MKKHIILSILIISTSLFSQFFSELQQGVRQEGMGEAFTGVADDGEAVYYNSAGLTNLDYIETIISYSRQLAHLTQGNENTGININYLGYAQNFGDKIGSFGFRWYYRAFNFGDVFNASEHIITLGYGRKLADLATLFPNQKWLKYIENLSVGTGIKLMNCGFYDSQALANNDFTGNKKDLSDWAYSLDFSLFYKLNKRYSFGFLFKDFNRPNSSIISQNGAYLDDMDYTLGASYRYSDNLKDIIAIDMMSENANYAFNIGTEKYWDFNYKNGTDTIILRSGTRIGFEQDYNWNIGGGYLLTKVGKRMGFDIIYDIRFDYNYKVLFGNISDGPGNHSIQFTFLFR